MGNLSFEDNLPNLHYSPITLNKNERWFASFYYVGKITMEYFVHVELYIEGYCLMHFQ